jgi:hypothetical protein
MIPVQVQQEVTGRLPLDQQQQLHEQVSKAAKSVNHKLKQGIAIPEQTIGYYQTARSAVQAVLDNQEATGYDPVPRRSGGWLTWSRFDVTGHAPELQQAWSGKCLQHHVSGANLADVLATGVLASSERRAVMGISSGLGMSEAADKLSGGASSVFLRVRTHASHGPALVWDDPAVLMSRADFYGFNGDHFGSVNPASSHATSGMTRDPYKIATFSSDSNEVMLRNGIDLLGDEAPSRIICGSPAQRTKILDLFKARGITQLRGKPVSDIVQ